MTKLEYNTKKVLEEIPFYEGSKQVCTDFDEYEIIEDVFTPEELEEACKGTEIDPGLLFDLKYWEVDGEKYAEKHDLIEQLCKYEFDYIDVKKDELYRHHKHGLVRAIRQSHGNADSWVFSKNLDSAFDKNASALENMVVIDESDLSEDY